MRCAEAVPHLDLNSTRMSAKHGLLSGMLRVEKGISLYCSRYPGLIKILPEDWIACAEFEAIGRVGSLYTTFAQHEKAFTGGYRPLMQSTLLRLLDKDAAGLAVIIRPLSTKGLSFPREIKSYSEFSLMGKICWDRALSEATARFTKSYSKRELAATQVDPRLWGSRGRKLFTEDQFKEARSAAKELLATYITKCRLFDGSLKDALHNSGDLRMS